MPLTLKKNSRSAYPRSYDDWLVPSSLGIGLLFAIYGFSPNFRWAPGPSASLYAGDFVQEWIGGYVVRSGDWSRFYDVSYVQRIQHDPDIVGYQWERTKYLPLVYPPFYYLIIAPLSLLPFWLAAWIWSGGITLCLLVALSLLIRQTNQLPWNGSESSKRLRYLLWVVPCVLLYMPVIESLTSSQKGPVCLLILTATYCLMNHHRRFWAGAVFGLLAFKPQFVLVIGLTMMVKRELRFVLGMISTVAVFLCMSLSFGVDVCRQYIDFSLGAGNYLLTSGYSLAESHCLYGFFTLASEYEMTFSRFLTVSSAVILVVILGRTLRGPLRTGTWLFSSQFAALVVATLLLSPHLFTYDLTLLVLPLYLIYLLQLQNPIANSGLRKPMIALMALTYVAPQIGVWFAQHYNVQITVLIHVALLIMIIRQSERIRESQGAEQVGGYSGFRLDTPSIGTVRP